MVFKIELVHKLLYALIIGVLFTSYSKGQSFVDIISSSGISSDRTFIHGIFDYNNDGFEDLILSGGGTFPNDFNKRVLKLYKNNQGNGTFSDVTNLSGIPKIDSLSNGNVFTSDFNNDGYQDFLSMSSPSKFKIFIGNGSAFVDRTTSFGLNLFRFNSVGSVKICDIDQDGYVDIVLFRTESSGLKTIGYLKNRLGTNSSFIWRPLINNIPSNIEPFFTIFDYDSDLDFDLIVSWQEMNKPWPGSFYYYFPRKTFRNVNFNFSEVTSITSNLGQAGEGYITDFDQDGNFDLIFNSPDYSPNSDYYIQVLKNQGGGNFIPFQNNLNLRLGRCYYYSPQEIDFNNDGFVDYQLRREGQNDCTGGICCDGTILWQGSQNGLTEVSSNFGLRLFCGLNQYQHKIAPFFNWFDLDKDGDLDIITSSFNDLSSAATSKLLKNNLPAQNWLKIKLEGCQSGKDAYYSQVLLYYNSKFQNKIKRPNNGYGLDGFAKNNPSSQLVHFGLGQIRQLDSIIVKWPSGSKTKIPNPSLNQELTIKEFSEPVFTVLPPSSICFGGSLRIETQPILGAAYHWFKNGTLIADSNKNSLTISDSGKYQIRISNSFGCQGKSIEVSIKKNPPLKFSQSKIICKGSSYAVADTIYSTAGTFIRKTMTRQGCDSIITTTITIAYPDTTYLDSIKCRGQTAKIGTKRFENPGLYKEVLTNRSGCDSVIFLNLKIIEPVTGSRSFTVCEGVAVTDAGKTFTSEGSFQTILRAKSTGCDSIHTTEIQYIKLSLELQQEPNSKIEYEQTSTLSASFSGPNQAFTWEPKELVDCSTCPKTRTVKLTQNTTFFGILRDTLFNCILKKEIKVLVNCPIDVPNLVTPNNDNLNDYLYLQSKNCIGKVLSLRVFNRWGKEIYYKTNYPEIPEIDLWNPAQPGTYYYQLELMEFEGDKRSLKGWIQVVK